MLLELRNFPGEMGRLSLSELALISVTNFWSKSWHKIQMQNSVRSMSTKVQTTVAKLRLRNSF